MSEIRKQALGMGLASLLGSSDEVETKNEPLTPIEISLHSIKPCLKQPRRSFPEDELKTLSLSIEDKGVLQPIVVRIHPQIPGQYEIVAGERRWRAANMAQLKTIPAIIREFSDAEALEVALLENLQRQDLDPIDEASGYRRLAEEFNHTQETLSRVVGKSRSHIANTLRLLTLPETIQTYVRNGQLSSGHARAILASENPEHLAELIIEQNLNVRQAETLAKKNLSPKDQETFSKAPDPEKEIIRQQLTELLDVPVDLVLKGLGGKIVINFRNPNELDHILGKLNSMG